MATDPVCGREVDEKEADSTSLTSQFAGDVFYFCSEECKRGFDRNPQEYVSAA